MLNKVFVSYSQSEAITFCFWKYFFETCGIEVKSFIIPKEQSCISKGTPHLIILGSERSACISSTSIGQIVYLVKKDEEYNNYFTKRSDVVPMTSWEQAGNAFISVLENLVVEQDELDTLKEILRIFISEKFWGTAWVFDEVAYENSDGLADFLVDSCEKMSEKLEYLTVTKNPESDWYRQFALLYCKYIQYGTHEKTLSGRLSDSQELLKECGKLAKAYGWRPTICMFAGKICSLSQVAHKYAIDYYKSIPKGERSADAYYNAGYIYENYVGDNELALYQYKRAAQLDSTCYQSVYKQGVHYEATGKWMTAYTFFNKVLRILEDRINPSISIQDLEYYCKSIRQLIKICEHNIDDDKLIDYYKARIQNLKTNFSTAFQEVFMYLNIDESIQQIVKDRVLGKLSKF